MNRIDAARAVASKKVEAADTPFPDHHLRSALCTRVRSSVSARLEQADDQLPTRLRRLTERQAAGSSPVG
jgi:hypothetical protein